MFSRDWQEDTPHFQQVGKTVYGNVQGRVTRVVLSYYEFELFHIQNHCKNIPNHICNLPISKRSPRKKTGQKQMQCSIYHTLPRYDMPADTAGDPDVGMHRPPQAAAAAVALPLIMRPVGRVENEFVDI